MFVRGIRWKEPVVSIPSPNAFGVPLANSSAQPIFLPSRNAGLKGVEKFRIMRNISEIFRKNSPFPKKFRIYFFAGGLPPRSPRAEAIAAKAGQSGSKWVKAIWSGFDGVTPHRGFIR